MLDFYRIKERSTKNGVIEIYPDFKVCRSKDLMVRGKSFYAIWDDQKGLWSTDEYDVQRLVDEELWARKDEIEKHTEGAINVKLMSDFSSNSWLNFRNYVSHISDSSHQLDEKLAFANTDVKKDDYVSRRLPYSLIEGDYSSWDELVDVLYDPQERAKVEWAIGAVVAGDSADIQKFIVLYGSAGTGKSTILNIIQALFSGYYTTFEAKALTGNSNAFSTEVFKSNPLVAIQHDGDLSKIEDNTKLNSIISHEEMTMNEKYKPSYMARINAFLFMGTNKPVKITDAKSGIIRRLIDVHPTGKKIPPKKYQALMSQIKFELGAIAWHCLEVYREMGKEYYAGYQPVEMMLQTDVFFNYIEANYDVFKAQDGASLNQAYSLYKEFCEESLIEYRLAKYKFREEFKNYFENFEERHMMDDGSRVRSWYSGFKKEKFSVQKAIDIHPYSLVLDKTESILDEVLKDEPAQYASSAETPIKKWENVDTHLSDLDTHKLHYVRTPLSHIVIDFDLKNEFGEKATELNLEAASKWPPTYAEFSKGGAGIHLHYIYTGDVTKLSRIYSEGIEIKVFTGKSSLRRKLSYCNSTPIATISTGLPLKEAKVINFDTVKSEKGLRDLIIRNLNKEIHPGTKPSIDFIFKILNDAYNSGLQYDVSDMTPKIIAFANNSSHQAAYCVSLVPKMKFKSDSLEKLETPATKDTRLVFFDVEVFPNLFLINWKYQYEGDKCVRMINPTPQEVEELMQMRLVGFNCRRYDNHILYARYMGYTNYQLYLLSQKIISGDRSALFGAAYSISYTDVYDFSSKKQSLKKFEIELGIHHQELGLPWDQPVAESRWEEVAEYCDNDVFATEATFEARKEDFEARKILASISGLSVNDTTQQHTARIIFGKERNVQDKFVYTHLDTIFPGYVYDHGKSTYRGETTGEGGYVYSEPGMYRNVALLDIASMHPSSIEALNLFGPYTKKFSRLKQGRIAVKHGDIEKAEQLLGSGVVAAISDETSRRALAYALKIAINIVYGLTSAKFPNAFKDPRNIDNIVAKRGALFMINLKHEVQDRGFKVAHIKTDSIKIPDATPEIIQFVMDYGKKYGYNFEHEATYDKICLVNDAVYIAHGAKDSPEDAGKWTATGAQFQHPYVFKTLFSKEPIVFSDLCETKTVNSALYLDFGHDDEHDYHFIGKAGQFCPVEDEAGGGVLLREKNGKYYSASGAKGYRWMESEMVKELNLQKLVDMRYFDNLVNDAVDNISKYGDFEWLIG